MDQLLAKVKNDLYIACEAPSCKCTTLSLETCKDTMTSTQRVLIIGCGIAGPILALLLKRKGYEPIIFEKVRELGDAGASLMINPNGNKVFGLLGLDEKLLDLSVPIEAYQDFTAAGEELGNSNLPSSFKQRYGQHAIGVRRTDLNLLLRDKVLAEGIDVREGWALERIDESVDGVTAQYTNSKIVQGAFLCGCDGIRAASRSLFLKNAAFEKSQPIYTGLSQIACFSRTPKALSGARMRNWYGDALHIIAYPVSSTHTSWAITQPQKEQTKETWKLYDKDEREVLKGEILKLLKGFDESVLEMVQNVERLTRYGLYDRDQIPAENWYSKRCVLVGDAAHPTSPHLGQGANQALEDCYHLSRLLPMGGDAGEDALVSAFKQYAELRQPRTAALVKGARAKGKMRVSGGADLESRNTAVKVSWEDEKALQAGYDALFGGHPFETDAEKLE